MKGILRRLKGEDHAECNHVRDLMSDYVDDELGEGPRGEVDEHIGICPKCRQVLANLRVTLGRVSTLGRSTPEDDEAVERIERTWRDRR
ncbi:MAG: anti-sigma factor family protein [Gaiellales bacterium]